MRDYTIPFPQPSAPPSSAPPARRKKSRTRRSSDPSQLACLGCSAELDWHQPDASDPDRLLGTCPGCGGWHVLDTAPRHGEVVFVLIPRDWDRGEDAPSRARPRPSQPGGADRGIAEAGGTTRCVQGPSHQPS